MANGDESKKTRLEILAPVVATILVAVITSLTTLYAASNKLRTASTELEEAKTELEQAMGFPAVAAEALPVGTIVSSTLPPEAFGKKPGEAPGFDPSVSRWAVANGQSVAGSAYAKYFGSSSVPDLRSMFLRGMNAGRTGEFADEERAAGTSQPWSTALPRATLGVAEAGGHVHYGINTNDNRSTEVVGHVGGGAGQHASGGHVGPAYGSTPMKEAGRHAHAITGGDRETRPNNVAVYFYVRINP